MFRQALRDVLAGARMRHLWMHMAITDITMHYRRSFIGPFWVTLQMAVMVGALALLYSALFHQDISTFLPYVAAGILAWSSISSMVNEGCQTFIRNSHLILHTNLPLPIFTFRDVARNGIIFVHNLAGILLIYMYAPENLTENVLLLLPGTVLLFLNGLWLSLVLGMISTRYRDMPQMVASLVQVAMFVTPVFWPISAIGERHIAVDGNVFYHFIEVVRAPILGNVPTILNYEVVLGTTLAGWLIALITYARYRSRVVFSL